MNDEYKRKSGKLEHVTVRLGSIEYKAADESESGKGSFKGLASTFGNTDLGGDIIERGAFDETMKEWDRRGELPAMLFGHDMHEPVGDFREMRAVSKGLQVAGDLWNDGPNPVPKSVQAHRMMTGTGPKGLSIGFIPKEWEFANGKGRNGRVRKLKSVDLLEVSIVSFPMNQKAVITQAKSLFQEEGGLIDIRTAEDVLRDVLGLTRQEAKGLLAKGWAGLQRDADSSDQRDADDNQSDNLGDLLKDITELTNILKGE